MGDNDTLSAQVAAMVQADLLVLLTDVDGLYTGNPNSDSTAKRLKKIETINREIIDMAGEQVHQRNWGGMTKIKAATIATESGVPVYICSSMKSDALIEAAEETRDGSFFVAQEKGLVPRNNGWPFMLKVRNDLGRWWSCRGTLKKTGKVSLWCGRSGRKLLLPRYCHSG